MCLFFILSRQKVNLRVKTIKGFYPHFLLSKNNISHKRYIETYSIVQI